MRRKSFSNRERFAILKRCNFACFYCGTPSQQGIVQLEIEHVVPVSREGGNEPWNLVAACRLCNSGKGASTPSAQMIRAARDIYLASLPSAGRVQVCTACDRPWIPDPEDEDPMAECWPCVMAWSSGYDASKRAVA